MHWGFAMRIWRGGDERHPALQNLPLIFVGADAPNGGRHPVLGVPVTKAGLQVVLSEAVP